MTAKPDVEGALREMAILLARLDGWREWAGGLATMSQSAEELRALTDAELQLLVRGRVRER